MDDLVKSFEDTFVSQEPKQRSDFESLYKNWGKLGNQEERRKELLQEQKINRSRQLDNLRGILQLVEIRDGVVFNSKEKEQEEEDSQIKQKHYRIRYTPSIYISGFNKTYNDVLMMSEWLVEKPEDFSENWYIVPCPKGTRLLVIAYQGTTKFFTKCGRFKFELRTALPGGNPNSKKGACCILDCFYKLQNSTLYVLDLLAWNNQPMTDCDTEFRDFWLKAKFAEIPALKVDSKINNLIFYLLPKISCSPESLKEFMMAFPPFPNNLPTLDGLLFYHKKAHYVSGETPLVGWLYPYMVPEVLGSDIPVHAMYMRLKPTHYVNQADFIEKFEEKQLKRNWNHKPVTNQNKNSKSKEMEHSGFFINASNKRVTNFVIPMEEAKPKESMEAESDQQETAKDEHSDVVSKEESKESENSNADTMEAD